MQELTVHSVRKNHLAFNGWPNLNILPLCAYSSEEDWFVSHWGKWKPEVKKLWNQITHKVDHDSFIVGLCEKLDEASGD